MNSWLSNAALGVTVLIFGICVGAAASTDLPSLGDWINQWQELIVGLVGTGAALTAAWIAWVALRGDAERARVEGIVKRCACADTLSTLLFLGGSQLARAPRRGIDPYIAPTCLEMLIDSMQVDPRLGAALGAFVRDAEDLSAALKESIETGIDRDNIVPAARVLALRSHLLGDAFQVASQALGSRGAVPIGPLLDRNKLSAHSGEAEVTDESIGWVRFVTEPHEFGPNLNRA